MTVPQYACPECHVVHEFKPTKQERDEANVTLMTDRAVDPDRKEYQARPTRKCSVCRKARRFEPVES